MAKTEMVSEEVERVARAIHFRGDDQGDDAWNHCQYWLRDLAREQARAAIEAIRGVDAGNAVAFRVKKFGFSEWSYYDYLHGAAYHSEATGNPIEPLYVLPPK